MGNSHQGISEKRGLEWEVLEVGKFEVLKVVSDEGLKKELVSLSRLSFGAAQDRRSTRHTSNNCQFD